MITRGRDLFAFMSASERDVRVHEFDDGLAFAAIGLVPEHRFVLETMHVYVALQNGVPIGYVQSTTLFRSAEINFNVFDSFRGAQASRVFVNFLSFVRATLGVDAFVINTQQLGEGNDEALRTGAFWFYHKHGFRPRDPDVLAVLRTEERRKARNRRHRSSLATLRRLAGGYLYRFVGRPRAHPVSDLDFEGVGLRLSRFLAERFGSDREHASAVCAREAAQRLGLRDRRGWSRDERVAWDRWAPLVLMLPGVERWSAPERRDLIDVVRAKGGVRESDYLERFERHRRLRAAITRLTTPSIAA